MLSFSLWCLNFRVEFGLLSLCLLSVIETLIHHTLTPIICIKSRAAHRHICLLLEVSQSSKAYHRRCFFLIWMKHYHDLLSSSSHIVLCTASFVGNGRLTLERLIFRIRIIHLLCVSSSNFLVLMRMHGQLSFHFLFLCWSPSRVSVYFLFSLDDLLLCCLWERDCLVLLNFSCLHDFVLVQSSLRNEVLHLLSHILI